MYNENPNHPNSRIRPRPEHVLQLARIRAVMLLEFEQFLNEKLAVGKRASDSWFVRPAKDLADANADDSTLRRGPIGPGAYTSKPQGRW